MTLITQVIIIYVYLPQTNAILSLAHWQVLLLLSSTALLTASGNVINDIYDVSTDIINKPDKVLVGKSITEKKAFTFYMVITSISVGFGFILANSVEKPALAGLFIGIAFLLYTYATTLKKMLLVGNILISILVGSVVLITALFELFPSITEFNKAYQLEALLHLTVFAIFAICVNLLREWIKDCQDMKGDHASGRSSLPLLLGKKRAAQAMAIYTLILVVIIGYLTTMELNTDPISLYGSLFLIMAPLLYVALRLFNVDSVKEFGILSLLCKVVLFVGIIGIGFIKFTV